MKVRKNLYLERASVARGEALAKEQGIALSAWVEQQLAHAANVPLKEEEFWEGPALKPIRRAGDARHDYLQEHHA